MKFTKMSGAGNDFIVVDNMDSSLDAVLDEQFIRQLCTRGLSVGADGLIEMRSDPEYDFRMRYYNCDGSPANLCGNGGRCIALFAVSRGIVSASGEFVFRSDAGIHHARVTGQEKVKLRMPEPLIHFLDRKLTAGGAVISVSFADVGVPHAVVFTDDPLFRLFDAAAPLLRKHECFGDPGVNVDFVLPLAPSTLRVRTWERGVEGETAACGTGAVAVVACAVELHDFILPVAVHVKSKQVLTVGRDAFGWWLEGEARIVFEGELCSSWMT